MMGCGVADGGKGATDAPRLMTPRPEGGGGGGGGAAFAEGKVPGAGGGFGARVAAGGGGGGGGGMREVPVCLAVASAGNSEDPPAPLTPGGLGACLTTLMAPKPCSLATPGDLDLG